MNHFQQVYNAHIKKKQFYINDSDESYKGIIRSVHKLWPGWFIIDELKRFNEQFPDVLERAPHLQDMVRYHYQSEIWDKFLGDQVTNPVTASILFDITVRNDIKHTHFIVFNAIHIITRSAIPVDKHKITLQTIHTVNSLNPVSFAKAVYGLHFNYLKQLENSEQFNLWFQA